MKVSDYMATRIADAGITQVFMVTGGGAMHLNDSFGFEPRMQCLFTHHEQAAAIAAEGYARVANRPALLNVTTGPGGINALTGVHGAWTDSIPMLVVSGQVKRETLVSSHNVPALRQLGDQEVDIAQMVRGITKYAECIGEPKAVRYALEKALYLATTGRPGPCWLDVPVDVQAAQIDPESLSGFEPTNLAPSGGPPLAVICADILARLRAAQRPVILVGTGVRLAGALDLFDRVSRRLGIPVVPAWTAVDQVPNDSPLFCGRASTIGDRAGNFTVQNSDVLLVLGSRLNIRQVSYNWSSFARHAFKIQVDVDEAELSKPTVRPDMPVHCDARALLCEMERQLAIDPSVASNHAAWLGWCKERVSKYPPVLPRQRTVKGGLVNPYHFMEELSRQLTANDTVVCGNATASVVAFQAFTIPSRLRMFANSGCAAMGYDLPAAIGAAVADRSRRVICLAGDGSIQMNIQELQTVFHHQLPIKIFVLNNDGYLSMRSTQGSFFGRLVGAGRTSGVSFPDIQRLAAAYGIPHVVASGQHFARVIEDVLQIDGPLVCEVVLDPEQQFEPKLSSRQLPDGRMVSSPLEDLYPFLSPEELGENLLIPTVEVE